MKANNRDYINISSVEELRQRRKLLATEICKSEKKIRNDYSVFKSSFSILGLASTVIRKVFTYSAAFRSAKMVFSLISGILPQLRKP